MTFLEVILIGVAITFIIFVVSKAIGVLRDFKNRTKDQPNVVYQILEQVYPKETREAMIVKEINRLRSIYAGVDGYKMLLPYMTDKFLDKMATRRTQEIDASNELSHYGSIDEFIELKEHGALGSAEIIAGNFGTPLGVVKGWLNSASHYEIIISSKYDACAIDSRWDESEQRWIDVFMVVDTYHDPEMNS